MAITMAQGMSGIREKLHQRQVRRA